MRLCRVNKLLLLSSLVTSIVTCVCRSFACVVTIYSFTCIRFELIFMNQILAIGELSAHRYRPRFTLC